MINSAPVWQHLSQNYSIVSTKAKHFQEQYDSNWCSFITVINILHCTLFFGLMTRSCELLKELLRMNKQQRRLMSRPSSERACWWSTEGWSEGDETYWHRVRTPVHPSVSAGSSAARRRRLSTDTLPLVEGRLCWSSPGQFQQKHVLYIHSLHTTGPRAAGLQSHHYSSKWVELIWAVFLLLLSDFNWVGCIINNATVTELFFIM